MLGNILGAVTGGIFSLIGGAMNNAANRSMANAQMNFQAGQTASSEQLARDVLTANFGLQREMVARGEAYQTQSVKDAMDYNTLMSNTAYQRGMADMKAAGLNPILAYGQGGATSPTASTTSALTAPGATVSRPAAGGSSARMEDIISPAVSNAIQGARVVTELEQLSANVAQTKAATALTLEQQAQARASTGLQVAQAITEGVRPELIRAQTRTEAGRPALLGAQTAQAASSAVRTRQEAEAFLRTGSGTVGQALNALETAIPRAPGFLNDLGNRIERGARSVYEWVR